jgi:hypothetical protein
MSGEIQVTTAELVRRMQQGWDEQQIVRPDVIAGESKPRGGVSRAAAAEEEKRFRQWA